MAFQKTPDDLPGVIEAFRKLLEVLIANYGTWGTLGIFAFIILASFGWKFYNNYRKDKEVNLALQEKDRTIQRLAEQERNFRILFFKEKAGWTDEQVERFVLRNEFPDVPSARKALEGEREGKEDSSNSSSSEDERNKP